MVNLYNDDCLNIFSNIGVGSVDFLLTDPPYNISKKNNFDTMLDSSGRKKYGSIDFGFWDRDFDERLWLERCIPLLRDGAGIIVFCDWKQLGLYREILEDNGCLVKNMLQWIKSNSAPKNRDRLYIVNYEVAIWATKGTGWTFNRLDKDMQKSQFYYPFVCGSERTSHPTQKSLRLMLDLVSIHSNSGDLVLDPFMGSGTTGLACSNLGRSFIGVEKCEEYYNIAKKRIDNDYRQYKLF